MLLPAGPPLGNPRGQACADCWQWTRPWQEQQHAGGFNNTGTASTPQQQQLQDLCPFRRCPRSRAPDMPGNSGMS
jgi:hypothetical protein